MSVAAGGKAPAGHVKGTRAQEDFLKRLEDDTPNIKYRNEYYLGKELTEGQFHDLESLYTTVMKEASRLLTAHHGLCIYGATPERKGFGCRFFATDRSGRSITADLVIPDEKRVNQHQLYTRETVVEMIDCLVGTILAEHQRYLARAGTDR